MSAIFGESLSFGQENGPDVERPRRTLTTYGDEHYARYEDLNGYTVVYDAALGVFCYARLEGNRFASTGVGLDAAPPEGIVRRLRESDAARIAKMEERELIKSVALPAGMSHGHEVVRTFGPNQGLLAGRQLSIGTVRDASDDSGPFSRRDQHRYGCRRRRDAQRRQLHPKRQHQP